MSGDGGTEEGGTLLGQGFIVALLVGALMVLYPFEPPSADGNVAATAMLALGFVVLASFTVGHLAETLGLPHITGYLVAGVLLGPSFAHLLPAGARIPPFDEGVLEPAVVEQLGLLDTLAVALIALTAGGELRLETLRKGLGAIVGVLTGQILAIVVLVGGFVVVVSGAAVPEIVLPGLGGVDATLPAIALGLVVAAISVATSPAATIAVINGAEARGAMTRLVLSTVVLKDVVVVVAFSLASVFASQMLGGGGGQQDLGVFLAVHIGGSLVGGAAIGLGMALYLRFVDREVLLFLVGVVYVSTFLANRIHLDPVLLFIAAGFAAANFSRQGEHLVHSVEKLSGPVYVVFFTLAGARLHLDEVAAVAPFAIALVLIRAVSMVVGTGLGGRLGGADAGTARYGWMGFVSQAGVALSLASLVGDSFGPPGTALQTLLIAGVALNELLGPVLLKVGLGLAGEIPQRARGGDPARGRASDAPPGLEELTVSRAPDTGRALFRTHALVEAIVGLGKRLHEVEQRVRDQAVAPRRRRAALLIGEVRRDLLRLHRRAMVAARGGTFDEATLDAETRALSRRVRDDLLAAAEDARTEVSVLPSLVDRIDDAAEGCPVRVDALFEPVAPAPWWRRLGAAVLRRGEPRRPIPVEELARFHLWGRAVAALPDVEGQLLGAVGGAAEPIDAAIDRALAAYRRALPNRPESMDGAGQGRTPRARLARARGVLEAAMDEAAAAVDGAYDAVDAAVGELFETALHAVERDLLVLGTRWLSASRRRSSLVFQQRNDGLRRLEADAPLHAARAAARLDRLAIDLDLRAFASAVGATRGAEVSRLARDLRGGTETQLARLRDALDTVRPALEDTWAGSGAIVAEPGSADRLRGLAEPVVDVMTQAEEAAADLVRRYTTDARETLAPLSKTLGQAVSALHHRYERAAGPEADAPLVAVPLREHVGADLAGSVTGALTEALQGMADDLTPLVEALRESRRLSLLNVDLAAGELELAEGGDPLERELLRQLVEPGLDRATDAAGTHLDVSRGFAPRLTEALDRVLDAFVARQREELAGERLVSRNEAGLRTPSLPPVRPLAPGRWTRWLRGLLSLIHPGARRADDDGSRPAPTELRDEGLRAPTPSTELPLAYRRLFEGEALDEGEAALASELDAAALARRLAARTGRLRTLALVGPPGVGKVAALRSMERSRAFPEAVRVSFDGPVSADDVEDALPGTRGKLIAIRGVEWLGRPGPGGLDALERLVTLILRDHGANAWVLAADAIPWEHAASLSPLGDAFPEVIRVAPLDEPRLRGALLSRHALSGFDLAFLDDRDADPEEQRRAEDRFFDAVHRASGGRVRDALAHWLGAVDRIDDLGAVHLRPPASRIGPTVLELDDESLLELFAVERWGWLDAEGLAESVRTDALRAGARLERLAQDGLLERVGHNGRPSYRVARHLRGWLTAATTGRGWVEEARP